MFILVRRICLAVVLVAIVVLVGTSLPTWWGGHFGGYRLLAHMTASGMVVVGLPLYAVLRWTDWLSAPLPSRASTWTFWALVFTGFLTIASMFACMLPSTTTPWMVTLIDFHGWIGATMAVAAIAHLITCRRVAAA
ncbi:hypothetical protein [Aporhodopirellula aestuarii]|uniref:Transmembrane protein n=1 Tax=Aporhodopirellula aestuarii TaxID=2950107 RepID=A0ABT0TZZ5_9BACT|nr:hypothetical protein [Aporhodopirellula aestuarii]MCM2370184.1 hypothetical protein [Aporhodopirellula aestuarii]